MDTTPRLELVSFALCPFVQRSVITLLHKHAPFDVTYIDLANPPDWFRKISPLGKVPALLVHEADQRTATLFESAVINEYVDEITPPSLLPADPLEKARERAWVEVASELLRLQYQGLLSRSPAEADQLFGSLWEILLRVEAHLPGGSYFRGEEFSLVDAAFAPFFTRLALVPFFHRSEEWGHLPKVRKWAASLARLREVRDSVRPDFERSYLESLRQSGSRFAA